MKQKLLAVVGFMLLLSAAGAWWFLTQPAPRDRWTDEETAILRSLWIGNLPPLPPDPSNAYADDPAAAVLGHKLFFDVRFSSNGEVSCATCHIPEMMFTDGLPLAQGVGTTDRKTMTIIGTAYSPWQFWDGRKDSQWAQALAPLESAVEHNGTRMQFVHLIDQHYRAEYEAIFGTLPDFSDRARFPDVAGPVVDGTARAAWEAMTPDDRDAVTRVFANMGKAIAAYERLILPGPSRFDHYVQALLENDRRGMQTALNNDEVAGLRLFIGQAQCIQCHNGPLFTNNDFHNTGVPTASGLPADNGRASGVQKLLVDEFNCLSPYSDASDNDCAELRFVTAEGEHLVAAFKPSTLRNIAETAPYMHAGQFATLAQVIMHYNHAAPGPLGHTELEPLHLNRFQRAQLEAFLRALSGPLQVAAKWLQAPSY